MVVLTHENTVPVSPNIMRSPDTKTFQVLSKVSENTPMQDKASPRFPIASSPLLEKVATPQRRAAASDFKLHEAEERVTLEAYKDVIDSTTEVVEVDGRDLEKSEWADPATGALLGYAPCHEDAFKEVGMDDTAAAEVVEESFQEEENEDEEASVPLRVTVEWQEQATGTMLGYALCGDDDEEVQAMNQLSEEQDEYIDTAQLQAHREHDDEEMPSTDAWTDTCWHKKCEWVDADSGVALAYECDDESDFGEHLPEAQKPTEWEDPSTGALLAYECDEDSDFGDHIEEDDIEEDDIEPTSTCDEDDIEDHNEEDDIEPRSNEEEAVGYGYGYGDASSESDSDASPALRKIEQRSRKCRKGIMRHKGLQMLRMRSQKIRRVIKGSHFRKSK